MGGFQKSPSLTQRHQRSSSLTSISHNNTKSSSSSNFSCYFPRTTSSQVQPKVSNTTTGGGSCTISDLLRFVEELQKKESRLLHYKSRRRWKRRGIFIRFLINEVNSAAFTNIEDVIAFVKWLDDELSFLFDVFFKVIVGDA